ncbi:MAG: cadherin domain-containing protein [Gammaproteobacteria bacterium]|nr:cadherin domain-containing protein [Gammaproteobacteria bacterium]
MSTRPRGQRRALSLSIPMAVLSVLLLVTHSSTLAQSAPGTVIDNVARAEFGIDALPRSVPSNVVSFAIEAPEGSAPTDIELDRQDVDERSRGAAIGNLTVLDPDPGASHAFTVDDPRFEVVGNVLKLRDDVELDFDVEELVVIEVTATDQSGNSLTVPFAIVVNPSFRVEALRCSSTGNSLEPAPGSENASAPGFIPSGSGSSLPIQNIGSASSLRPLDALICENVTGAAIAQFEVPATSDFAFSVDDARFTVTGDGILRLRPGLFLDHEQEPEVSFDVQVFRDGVLYRIQPVTLEVRDLNERPTDILLDDLTFASRTPGAVLGNISVVDEDLGDTHTFTFSDHRFVVVDGVLRLAPDEAVDFDLESEILLDVTAMDSGGLSIRRRFTLTVVPSNLPPVAEDLVLGVARAATVNTVIGRIPASDPNVRDTLSYSLVGGGDGRFLVGAEDGRVRVAPGAVLGPEGTMYDLQVRVTDDNTANDPVGQLSTTANVRITVTESNTPPFVTDQTFDPLPEQSPVGTRAGVVGATDVDRPLRFVIVGGNSQGIFSIDAATGVVRVARPELLRFDQGATRVIDVAVTDSHPTPLTSVAAITIPLLELPKAPIVQPAEFKVADRAAVGTVVGTVDARFGGGPVPMGVSVHLIYEIVSGNEGGAFRIDPATGLIEVANSGAVRREQPSEFNLRVRVTESIPRTAGGRLFTEVDVDIEVLAAQPGPENILLDQEVIPANAPGARVGDLTVIDPNQADGHLLTVDDPRFRIVGRELRLAPGVSLSPDTLVTLRVTAVDDFGLSVTRPFTVGTAVQERNPATILFLKVPPPIGADVQQLTSAQGSFVPDLSAPVDVGTTQCATVDSMDGPFVDAQRPRGLDNQQLNVPGALTLRNASLYMVGEPIFVGLHDPDANRDSSVREQVVITLTVADTGDREILRLRETGPDTGFFVGAIQSTGSATSRFGCMLTVQSNSEIIASYFDEEDGSDTAAAAATVAPSGVVFDSQTGRRIDDAVIRVIDENAGRPAKVFGDAPFPEFPAEILSGGEVTDAVGTRYDFGAGEFRFPFLPQGRYRIEVTPPNRYRFPSERSDADLLAVDGGPYDIGPASRGQVFEVEIGPGVQVDIPLDLQPIARTPSTLELLTLATGDADAESIPVSRTQCEGNSGTVQIDLPRDRSGQFIDLPGAVELQPATAFNVGEPVFVRLIDPDQDVDPAAPDTVTVRLRIADTGESETLILRETGASTGVFTGYLNAGASTLGAGDCRLGSDTNGRLEARYQDPEDASDRSVARALLDPVGRIFDSATGELLDGVRITLVEAASGAPATVRGLDGVASWPSTVLSGEAVTDGAGNSVSVPAGGFRFPVVGAGEYRYQIEMPDGYRFPSLVDDADLQQLDTAPFLLGDASRGEAFEAAEGVTPIADVPLDPVVVDLFLTKRALSDTAAVGDFIQYELAVENPSSMASGALELLDFMPVGFRYQSGSARIGADRVPNVVVERDGRSLRIPLPNLDPGQRVSIRYVSEITGGAREGIAVNRATAVGEGVRSSNTAEAKVRVREDLLRSRATLMGRVLEGPCDAPTADRKGLGGVRLYMEDGTYVVTDSEGRWHIEGVKPGAHVVQLDEASLPASHRIMSCEDNVRFAGTPFSQFVDVQGGTLWQADFHVTMRPPETSDVIQRLRGRINGDRLLVRAELTGGALPLTDATQVIMLPEGWSYLPGSTRIEGRAVDDPSGFEQGALTYRLGNLPSNWQRTVTLMAEPKAGVDGSGKVQSMFMFRSPTDERVRLPVASFNVDDVPDQTAGQRIAVATMGHEATSGISREHLERVLRQAALDPAVTVELVTDASAGGKTGCGRECLSLAEAIAVVDGVVGRSPEIIGEDQGMVVAVRLLRPGATTRVIRAGDDSVARATVTGHVPGTGPAANRLPPIPELPDQRLPEFRGAELAALDGSHAIVWPTAEFLPRIRAVHFAVKHPIDQRAEARINGVPVSPLLFEGAKKFEAQGIGMSVWNGVPLQDGDNLLEVRFFKGREQVAELSRQVRFAGGPVRAELVPERSVPVADGIEPPIIAIRLYDRTGSPVRPGMTGSFTVREPYQAYESEREQTQINLNSMGNRRSSYVVREDGIAFIQLQPTTRSGEVVFDFEFADRRSDEIRTRLTPAMRDWILVGFAEGTVGYQTLSGNMQAAQDVGHDDGIVTDGRVSLFASGSIQGKYLLTMAYDSKGSSDDLGSQIDPNRFYTLYGDASQQGYDAESQRKLYLRIERDTAQLLFGDFDTGLTVTELGRYSRRFTGVKGEYENSRWNVTGFAAAPDQAFLRDDIRGDGTSGLYRLGARNVIANSERIRIETRDRFDIDEVIDERSLTRFRDYNIDYDAGTLLFKEPIMSQDEYLNPIFIIVEYETDGSGSNDVIVGGRIARKLDGAGSEVGLTAVYDGSSNNEQRLGALDARVRLGDRTEVKAELAYTEAESRTDSHSGWAYRVEAEHGTGSLNARAYIREQREGFGIGQQFSGSGGTRRYGARVDQDLGGNFRVDSEAFQEDNLSSGNTRRVGDTQVKWKRERSELGLGARVVRESREGSTLESNLVTARASQAFLDGRLRLNANGEYDVSGGGGRGENTDFPTRLGVGGDYEIFSGIRLFGRQEYTFGNDRDSEDTRFGVRSDLWSGATMETGLSRRLSDDQERIAATAGLVQNIRLSDRWRLDLGMDREQTLKDSRDFPTPPGTGVEERNPGGFNPRVPPISGSNGNDFTAGFIGLGYKRDRWEATSRLEYRNSDSEDRWNLFAGYAHQLDDGRIASLRLNMMETDGRDSLERKADMRLGLAWRPSNSTWTFLDRLDLVASERKGVDLDLVQRKLVNNFNANWRPNALNQLSLIWGMKYVVDDIDGDRYSGVTSLYGFEYRRDLNSRWDVGLHGGALHSWNSNVIDYQTGVSVGHSPWRNVWISLGYNFDGFHDDDFAGAHYTAQGPFMRFRLKVDQHSVRDYLGAMPFNF